jgi:hypothetical protein
MRFIPSLLKDFLNLREGLTTESEVLQYILSVLQASKRHAYDVEEHSRRTAELVVYHSWRL